MGAISSPTKPGNVGAMGDFWVDPATGIQYFFDGASYRGPRLHIVANQHGVAAANWAVTGYIWTNPNGVYVVRRFSTRYKTAGGSGCVLDLEVCPTTVAAGSGTLQTSASIDMTATADIAYNGALIAAPTQIVAGSALSLKIGGTVTGLAYCTVDVELERLS